MLDRLNKIISIIIAIVFTANSLGYAEPAVNPQPTVYSLQSINIPESYGRVENSVNCKLSTVNTAKSPLVILIKDAHCNYEAQRNIAKILDILIKDYKIDLVGIEGASGDVDPSVIAGSPDAKRRKGVADKYLKKGWLTASEALAMERGRDYGFSIWGVEDFKLYLNDLKAFREVYEGCGVAERFIEICKDVISNLKNKIYSKDAFEFDKKVSEYRENSLALSKFINYLAKTCPDYIREFHNLKLVLKAIKIEKNIDFNKVAKERDELIKECEKKLPKEEIEQLVRNSLLYRLGKISSLEYYKYLEPLAISLKPEATNLKRYIRNVKLHSKIDEDGLFNEIDKLIEDIYKYYIKDGIAIRLHEADEYVYLLNKLLRLEIARDELVKYRKYCLRPSQIVDFLKIQGNLNNINIPPEFIDQGFILQVEDFYKQPEEFYGYAIERDKALVENLVARMKDENKNRAVLIAGGFHADGAEKLLNENGVEVITITPSITKEDTEAKKIYLSRMMDERLQPDRLLNEMGLGNLSATAVTTVNLRGIYGPVLAGIRDESVRGELERALASAKTHEDFARAIKAVIDKVGGEPGTDELVLRTLEDLHRLATTGRLPEARKGGQAEAGKRVWDFETESIDIDGITVTAPSPFMPILRTMLNKLYLPEPLYAGDFHRLTPMKPIDVFAFTAGELGVKGREIRIIIGEMQYIDISEDGEALEISISKFKIANPNMGFSGAIDDVLKILILNKGQVVTTRNIAEQKIRESSRVRMFGRYLQNEGAAYNITPGMQKAYYRGVNLARLQQLSEEKKFTGANSDSLFVDLEPTIWASSDIGCAEIYAGKNIGVIFKLRKETIGRDFKVSPGWQGWTVNEIMLRSKDEKPIEIPLSGAYIEEILVFDEASYEQAKRLFPDIPIRQIFNPDQADQYLAENGEVTNVQLEEYYSMEERLPEYMGRPLSYDCKALQLAEVSPDASYEEFRAGLVSKKETLKNEIKSILESAGLRCDPFDPDPVRSSWLGLAEYVVRNTFVTDTQTREKIKGPFSLYQEVREQLAIFDSLAYLRDKAIKFKIRQKLEETAGALSGQEGLRRAFSKAIDALREIERGGWASRGYDKADEVKWHDYTHAGNNTLEAVSAMKRIQESLRQTGYEIPEEAVLLTAIAGMYHDVGYYKADEMFGTIKVDHEKRSMDFVKNNAGELGLSARDVTLVCLVIAGTQAGVQPGQWNEMEELVKKILDGKADESDVRKLTEMIKGLTEQTETGLNLTDKNELSLLLGVIYGARVIASLDIWDTRGNAVELIASLRKEFARDHEILRRYLIGRGVKQDDIPELVKAKDKGTFLKEKGVAVDDKVLKAAIEISKIVVAPSDAEQVGGTHGFYLYFADKRVKELGVWDFIDVGAKWRFEETRKRVKERFDEMQARVKTGGAIIPELQEQFGTLGERPLYRYLIGPAFEEFGLLGYLLVLLLRPLNIISRAEIQEINRNIKEIFKHSLGIGFRGLPLFLGVALSFISPFLACVSIILVFATGIVFVARHPEEKDKIAGIVMLTALFIMGLSAILINSAGEFLTVGLALIPTFLFIHSEVNIIDDIRTVKPKKSTPVTVPKVIEEDEEPTIPIVYPRKVEGIWRLYNMLKAFIDAVSIPRIAAIPDIHGNLARLDEILERVEGQADKIVFLGDYMDRGSQGIAVVERVNQLTKEGRAIPLMGNHDLLFIMSMMGDYHSFLTLMLNGGIEVLKELAREGLIEQRYQARLVELIILFDKYMQKYKDAMIAISAMHANGMLKELQGIARENARLREIAAWMKENLNLYYIGENGALYVHAGFLIDKNGNAVLKYAQDGVKYSGLEALAKLEEGMRKAFREDDLKSRALGFLQNTILSPLWVREATNKRDMFDVLKETGCERMLDQLGIAMLVVGHNQVNDMVNIGNGFFAIDRKMVKGKGAVLRTHPEGLVYDPTTDIPRYVLGRPELQRLVWDGKVRAQRLIGIVENRLMSGKLATGYRGMVPRNRTRQSRFSANQGAGVGIIPELQEQFGEFGKTSLYAHLVGPVFEEFGMLLGYPLVLILRVFNLISKDDLNGINKNIKQILKYSLGVGYRGLPLVIGTINPVLGIIFAILAGVLFIYLHPQGKRTSATIITALASLLLISLFAITAMGLITAVAGLVLIPVNIFIHRRINIAQGGREATWEPVKPESAEIVKNSQEAFGYSDPKQDFRGVSLEHFIWAMNRLAGKKQSVLGVGLSREDIDIINNGTYQDPRVAIEIIGQNPNPRAQGVYEAVANGLDALGFNIGQFGKGVKQIISWLGPTGADRIDVFTRKENGVPYRLTILRDKNGQNYIQIREISAEEFTKIGGVSCGTIVKVTTASRIPRTEEELDEKHRNSQEGIVNGIHKRFPYIRAIKITTQIGEEEPEEVNGFKEKTDIVPPQTVSEMPKDREDRRIHVRLTDHTITIIDNGIGMDAEIISRMFVPKIGTKHPEPLRGEKVQEELKKVKVVHDASLPHRVSFSRNGEVIRAVDIPQGLMESATVSGGLQVEIGGLMDVPESRDNIIISPDLKAGETTNFQKAVLYAIGEIIKHPRLSNAEKLIYINTIAVGLSGLVQGNDEIAYVVNAIYISIQESLKPVIEELRQEGFIILPHDKQFGQISIPAGKKVIFINEKLFNWQGAVSLREIGARIIPWVTLGGEERLPLVVIPFRPESVKHILGFNVDWHRLREDERVPIIRTDRFIAIPEELGERLYELAEKRVRGLTDEEEKEFNSLLERLNIITSKEVVTSYELTKPRENMVVVPRGEIRIVTGEIDSEAINGFLTPESVAGRVSEERIGSIPTDANQRYTLLENGDVLEIGTGNVVERGVVEIEYLTNGFYKVTKKDGTISVKKYGDGHLRAQLFRTFIDITFDKELVELIVSPDKKFVFIRKKERRHVDIVIDLEREEKRSLPEDFKVAEIGSADTSNKQASDLRFSRNGKYLTYLEETLFGFGGMYLVAVDLEKREIVKRVEVWGGASIIPTGIDRSDVAYEINPYANVVYVKQPTMGRDQLLLIDLDDGEKERFVASTVWNKLYTDSTGAYTVLVDYAGEQCVYIHETKRILKANDFGGNSILKVITVFQDGEIFYCVETDVDWAYFDKRGEISDKRIKKDKPGYMEKFGVGDVSFCQTSGYILRPWIKVDPLQRLDRGVYKHPQFHLIIDKRDPDKPIAINPVTGAECQYEGEIVGFVSGEFLLTRVENQVFVYNKRGELETRINAISDKIPAIYTVVLMGGDDFYDIVRIQRGLTKIQSPSCPVRRKDYPSIIFDGKYFVFTNPKTGDVAYVDPEKPDNPMFVPAEGERVGVDSPNARSLADSVLNMRNGFIQQVQDAYRPFLALIPEEYRRGIEGFLKVLIRELYREQEKAILDILQDAIRQGLTVGELEQRLNESVLPFSCFSRNMEHIMQHLPAYINSNRVKGLLLQERHKVESEFYPNIFGALFNLSQKVDLTTIGCDMDMLFKVIMYYWNTDGQERIGLIPIIARFVTGLEDAVGIAVKILTMGKMLGILSGAISQSPHEKSRILRMQIEKILNSESRREILVKMYQAFEKIDDSAIFRYLADPSHIDELGDARPFIVFLTNEVEQVREKDRFIPNGEDVVIPGDGVEISQIVQLEQQRKKRGRGDVVMDIDYLIDNLSSLPERSSALEMDILQNVTVQRESGAYTAEITQNSFDATKEIREEEREGELVVDFYIQRDEKGEEEYVEEAADNGTGALKEVALLIPKSTKAEGGQVSLTGFFGTGKYTIFEGVDRVEIITKNESRAFMFVFNVIREDGKPIAVKLTGIRRISDEGVRQGVTVRRIKAVRNTIPELDQMLSQRAWKTFAGLAQHDRFTIYFIDSKGDKHPLTVDKEVLSEVEFRAVKPEDTEETSFGRMRIISTKDMPLQIVDRIGLRVCEIKEEYLALIPHSLRRHLKELGIVVQIPLPLIRNRSGFEKENYYLPVIQRYIAIAFYRAIAYKALTQTSPQFVFDGLPLEWETNDDYWDSIDSSRDKKTIELAKKINSSRCTQISNADLEGLLVSEGRLDTRKMALKLILQLEAEVDGKPVSLAGRRLAIQLEINRERAERQRRMLEIPVDSIPSVSEIPLYEAKIAQAQGIELGHEQMRTPGGYIVPQEEYTPKEHELINLAMAIARNFGIENIVLMNEQVAFAGAFRGNTFYLNRSLAEKIGMADRGKGFIDEATNTIVHELAHYLEHLMITERTQLDSDEVYVAEVANFTHDAVGTFAEAMKYVAAVSVAARDGVTVERPLYGKPIRDELIARFGVDIDGELEPVLGQRLKDLLEILEEDGRVTEDEVGVIVDKAKLAVSVFNEYKGKGLKERLDLAQEIVAVQWAIEELERNKVPEFINELIKALGGDEAIVRELVMELYNYNGYDDYFVLMLSGIRAMFGIKEGTDADRYLKMLDRYVMVKSRFEVKENRFVSVNSGDEVYDVLMEHRNKNRLKGTTEDAETLLSKVADIVARYIVDNNEILNLFKDDAKKRQIVREGIDALIIRKELAKQIEPQKFLPDTADLNLVKPVVVDARYLLIPKKGAGYAISAMAEQLKWVLLRAGDKLMILYDGAEEGRDLIAEWLGAGVGRFITEAEYPKDTEGVVAMLTHGTASRLKDKSGSHRVVKGKENGEDDLMLMGHIAGILGSVEVLSGESIGDPLRELYKAYYKEDRTEMVQKIIESIQNGVSIVIELPPIAPFVRPYYNALKQAMEMTGSAA